MKNRLLLVVLVTSLAVFIAAVIALAVRHPRGATVAPPPVVQKPEPPPPPPQKPYEWNTYHGNSALTGVADVSLPEQLDVLWRFKAGAPVRETPVIAGERLFFPTAHGAVIAADFNGQRVWSQVLLTGAQNNGEPVRERIESPVAYFDGVVYVGTSRGVLYALDAATGVEKWRAEVDGPILGTPNYGHNKAGVAVVYVIGRAHAVLYAFDASNGHVLSKSDEIERCDGSPSVSADAVVFGSCAAALHVFSTDTGKLLRSIPIDEDSQVAGGVAMEGGRAFSGCRSGKILEFDVSAGKILWTNPESKVEVFSTPALSKEWVIASSSDGNVYGLDRAAGTTRWRFDTKGDPSSPVIAGDKVVVAADGELFLLRLGDGAKLWSLKVSDEITPPSVAPGKAFVGSEDGTVVAFGPAAKPVETQSEKGTP